MYLTYYNGYCRKVKHKSLQRVKRGWIVLFGKKEMVFPVGTTTGRPVPVSPI